MSTDYQILLEKFQNFKNYVTQIAKDKRTIKDYESMTNNEFLLFGSCFLLPNKDKLEQIMVQLCQKLKVNQPDQREKLQRYMECFIEYLEQLDSTKIAKECIVGCSEELGIPLLVPKA